MNPEMLLSLAACVGVALVHLLADRVHAERGVRLRRWLSLAAGTSVAFVFVHLMPELHRAQQVVATNGGEAAPSLDHPVYLAALGGLVTYYGLEHAALARGRGGRERGRGLSEAGFFWAHVALFALFNALLGYLLVRESREAPLGFAVLWLALALHTFSNDFALRVHHGAAYHRVGRWVLAVGVLVGWALGELATLAEVAFAFPLAFAAGGIVLNALKEELPAQRESRFGAFLLGAALYVGLGLVA